LLAGSVVSEHNNQDLEDNQVALETTHHSAGLQHMALRQQDSDHPKQEALEPKLQQRVLDHRRTVLAEAALEAHLQQRPR